MKKIWGKFLPALTISPGMVNKDACWQTSWRAEIGGGVLREEKKQKSTREWESLEQIYESQPKDETEPSRGAANSIDKEAGRLQGSTPRRRANYTAWNAQARALIPLTHIQTYN